MRVICQSSFKLVLSIVSLHTKCGRALSQETSSLPLRNIYALPAHLHGLSVHGSIHFYKQTRRPQNRDAGERSLSLWSLFQHDFALTIRTAC